MKNLRLLFISLILMTSCDASLDGTSDGDSEYSSSDVDSSGGNGQNTSAGQVTAGEWNDLNNWSFWLDLLENEDYSESVTHWDYYTMNRLAFEIKDSSMNPINGATVALYQNDILITEAKTDNFGKINLFIDLNTEHNTYKNLENYGYTVNDVAVLEPILSYNEGVNNYIIGNNNIDAVTNKIEISFIVDATSSMADELEFLKNDLQDVISEIQNANAMSTILTSTVFYRDSGDDYVVKHSDFTSNSNSTINYIEEQSANGGGDYPEAVDVALNTAINELQWSTDSKSKLAFLLLDAPPHHDPQVISNIHSTIQTAAKKGIRVIPVTASGIDKSTEFLMRFFAIATNGTYVFITNDSGIGNDHLEPTVGQYEVEYLNELLVRLINTYSE